MCLLMTVTPLAFATDYLLAYSELNASASPLPVWP